MLVIMIITVANVKGGVGKTVTTMFVATGLARRGIATRVWDMDRQGSALEWARIATQKGQELGFEVQGVSPEQLDGKVREVRAGEYVLIDTPPGEVKAIDAAIHVADFVVIPTKSRQDDMSRMWRLISVLGDKPYGVLLTQVKTGTSSKKAAFAALEKYQASFFDVAIPEREAIGASFGSVPTNLFTYVEVIKEIVGN